MNWEKELIKYQIIHIEEDEKERLVRIKWIWEATRASSLLVLVCVYLSAQSLCICRMCALAMQTAQWESRDCCPDNGSRGPRETFYATGEVQFFAGGPQPSCHCAEPGTVRRSHQTGRSQIAHHLTPTTKRDIIFWNWLL